MTFDGRETAPAAADRLRCSWPDGTAAAAQQAIPGGRSVGVPGNVAMLALAHARIRQAAVGGAVRPGDRAGRGGYDVTPRMAQAIAGSARDAGAQPGAAALFLHADGSAEGGGERIVNPALAATLSAIAAGGPTRSTGATRAARRRRGRPRADQPAKMTAADLAAYRAKERAPVCGAYRG